MTNLNESASEGESSLGLRIEIAKGEMRELVDKYTDKDLKPKIEDAENDLKWASERLPLLKLDPSSKELAVTATMLGSKSQFLLSALIRLVASYPSIIGIRISININ